MGDRKGHFLPGFFFLAAGLFFLLLCFKRSRSSGAPLSSFVPESNPRVLALSGGVIFGCTLVGILSEAINCVIVCTDGFFANVFHQSLHEALYASFMLVGLTALLESKSLLPVETWRRMLCLALFVESQLWGAHAEMQSGAEKIQHQLLSNLSLASSLVCIMSVAVQSDMFLHLAVWVLLTMQGVWLISIGTTITMSGSHTTMSMHHVTPIFYLELLCIAAAVLVVAGVVSKRNSSGGNSAAENLNSAPLERQSGPAATFGKIASRLKQNKKYLKVAKSDVNGNRLQDQGLGRVESEDGLL
jgi:hypothetical protein